MKFRATLASILILTVWVSGCAARLPAEPVTHSFCCELSAEDGGDPFAGTLTVTEQLLKWELTAPQTVAGCILTCDGASVVLTPPDGEPVSADAAGLPADGAVSVLWNVLRTADPASVRWEDGDGCMTGRVTGGRYTLLCDADTGLPKNLRLNGKTLSLTFTNARKIEV